MITHKKIYDSISEFNQSQTVSALSIACSVLRQHPILNPQFVSVKNALLQSNKVSPLTLRSEHTDTTDEHPGQPPKDRVIENFCLYMSAVEDDKDGHITAVSDFIKVTSQNCLTVTRGWPLLIAAQKIEYQYIKGTGQTFDYLNDDILFALFFSVALSKGLECLLKADNDVAPIAIPHKYGLFLGTARRNIEDENNGYGISYYRTSKVVRGKKPIVAVSKDPNFVITSCIDTFLPCREMRSDYSRLYTYLSDLRKNTAFLKSLVSCFETLSRPPVYSVKELEKHSEVLAEIVDFMTKLVRCNTWQDTLAKRPTSVITTSQLHGRAKFG